MPFGTAGVQSIPRDAGPRVTSEGRALLNLEETATRLKSQIWNGIPPSPHIEGRLLAIVHQLRNEADQRTFRQGAFIFQPESQET